MVNQFQGPENSPHFNSGSRIEVLAWGNVARLNRTPENSFFHVKSSGPLSILGDACHSGKEKSWSITVPDELAHRLLESSPLHACVNCPLSKPCRARGHNSTSSCGWLLCGDSESDDSKSPSQVAAGCLCISSTPNVPLTSHSWPPYARSAVQLISPWSLPFLQEVHH